MKLPKLTVVAPDAGGVERARAYAKRLGAELAIIDKRRDYERLGEVEVLHVVGDVEGRTALIIDDMIDTAGTLVKAAEALKANGADAVLASATHAVLSGPAVERIQASPLKEVVVTNTIPTENVCHCSEDKMLERGKASGPSYFVYSRRDICEQTVYSID